jgi:hypothetical protein
MSRSPFRQFGEELGKIYQVIASTMTPSEPEVAGVEMRHYVRGAMQPDGTDAEVRAILAGDAEGCAFMTRAQRARVAAAHMTGATEAGAGGQLLAWHRLIGDQAVLVR